MTSPTDWLHALAPTLTPGLAATTAMHPTWHALNTDLTALLHDAPARDNHTARSTWLQTIRRNLTHHTSPSPTWQTGAQFIAGYHDLDLREATGTSHGQMILNHATPALAAAWRARLAAGDLVGIAATEAHGGSRIQEITTAASVTRGGLWRIDGEKRWVSRLNEAAAFVVFVRDPQGGISAVVVEHDTPGVAATPLEPAGLAGWSWGRLRFDGARIDPAANLLGVPGQGMDIFRSHFAAFRPLVAACALGAAASVHDQVRQHLTTRMVSGLRIRDNALMALGSAWAAIYAATLLTFHASRTVDLDSPHGTLFSRLSKAYAVDTASQTVDDLALLLGAQGFQRNHPVAKARADLAALQFADGIHDSLYRSGGTEILRSAR